MRRPPRSFVVVTAVAVTLSVPSAALAEEPAPPPPSPETAAPADTAAPVEDPTVIAARREFVEGTALVRAERWGEALASFERAAKLKPHAITSYNIAQCERAMGQFTRARQALRAALASNEASGRRELPESVDGDARALLAEVDRILPRVTVRMKPVDAALAVDGRPLEPTDDALVAGTMPPGRGVSPGLATFVLVTNPGVHVMTVSRQGYQDAVVTRTFTAGTTSVLDLELDRLPATIHVTSNLRDAIVRVDDSDVGNAPVDVSRTAGRYHVLVSRKGFLPYESDVSVGPGERVELAASLREDKPALTQRWWFWAGVGVLVAGAATTTYFAARSSADPQRPPTDGGGLGWSLQVP